MRTRHPGQCAHAHSEAFWWNPHEDAGLVDSGTGKRIEGTPKLSLYGSKVSYLRAWGVPGIARKLSA